MMKMFIKFKHPREVLDFVNRAGKYPCEIDMKRGRFVVDGKSILGVMNLGMNAIIELQAYGESSYDLKQEIKRYVVA